MQNDIVRKLAEVAEISATSASSAISQITPRHWQINMIYMCLESYSNLIVTS